MRGKIINHGLQLWHFNSDQMKSWLHSRVEWPHDQPGGWWLPDDISDDYCKQIVAEQRSVKPSGKVVWVQIKKDNHFLDAEALAYSAAKIISAGREFVIEGQNGQASTKLKRRIISKGISV